MEHIELSTTTSDDGSVAVVCIIRMSHNADSGESIELSTIEFSLY